MQAMRNHQQFSNSERAVQVARQRYYQQMAQQQQQQQQQQKVSASNGKEEKKPENVNAIGLKENTANLLVLLVMGGVALLLVDAILRMRKKQS